MRQVHILLILTAILVALTAPMAEAVSNTALLYLRIAAGARPAGMGEAFVSVADDATATYWNPAGLGNPPVAGFMESKDFSREIGEISSAVTLKGFKGDVETWVIAGDQLFMYNGKEWRIGREFPTSADQTLLDFIRPIVNVDDEKRLEAAAKRVVAANFSVSETEIQAFADTIRAHIPEGYKEADELQRGLDTLQSGFAGALLNANQFNSLRGKLSDGLKDGVLTAEELDRITYSLDQTVMRYLPSRLLVPYTAGFAARMTCLAATGDYLWVGSEDGLYRLSGVSWARYSVANGLPSDTILSLGGRENWLLIGTGLGVAEYSQGNFKTFADLPKAPATAVAYGSLTEGYAVIGRVLYRYDGQIWHEGYPYTVRIDDSIDKLADRVAIYHTPSEHEYLVNKIRELNANNAPAAAGLPAPGDSLAMPNVPDSGLAVTPEGGEGNAVPDSAIAATAAGEQTQEPGAVDSWLVEGNSIQLPYSPIIRYDVTALHIGLYNAIWIGTTSGLLNFDGFAWTTHGYMRYTVRGPDSTGAASPMTADDIARNFLSVGDSAQVATLAANIDEYNELNGAAIQPGQSVLVYNQNLGSSIRSIGSVFGDVYVGTEYGLEKRLSSSLWEEVRVKGFGRQPVVGVYDFEGQAYYVGASALGVETKGRREFVVMFVKWLPTLVEDMYYGYMSYVHHARGIGTFGLSAIYLSYGAIQFTGEQGEDLGTESPFEFTIAGSFGTSLNSSLKLGGTVKFIHSHLAEQGVAQERGKGIASAFAVDAGVLYKITNRLQFGSAITNLGPEITYIDAAQSDPLPRNLGIGLSYKLWDSPYNRVVIQGEMNTILARIPGRGFRDVSKNALKRATLHIGGEYWYSDFIALRAGYKHDEEGDVKHLTFGAGLQYQAARFDLAYIPSSVDSPLANILRISFSLMF